MTSHEGEGGDAAPGGTSSRAGPVLIALILTAAVASLNLPVANVAPAAARKAFNTSQAQLNLIAAGHGLGLVASVLYLGRWATGMAVSSCC